LTQSLGVGESSESLSATHLAPTHFLARRASFKFTHPAGHIWFRTRAAANLVFLDIEDECGGLAPGQAESLFRPFQQRSSDRSGLGLGLSISQRAVRLHGGEIRVRNLPGKGCIFTVELPRKLPATA
jgi:signal transduction histidine kinase